MAAQEKGLDPTRGFATPGGVSFATSRAGGAGIASGSPRATIAREHERTQAKPDDVYNHTTRHEHTRERTCSSRPTSRPRPLVVALQPPGGRRPQKDPGDLELCPVRGSARRLGRQRGQKGPGRPSEGPTSVRWVPLLDGTRTTLVAPPPFPPDRNQGGVRKGRDPSSPRPPAKGAKGDSDRAVSPTLRASRPETP